MGLVYIRSFKDNKKWCGSVVDEIRVGNDMHRDVASAGDSGSVGWVYAVQSHNPNPLESHSDLCPSGGISLPS